MNRTSVPWRLWAVVMLVPSVLLLSVCNADEPFTAAPPDDIGKVCAFDWECTYGCTAGVQGSHDFCTHSCDAAPCPTGYVCVARGALGHVCAIASCSGNTGCPADYTCYSDQDFQDVCRHVDIPCTTDADCPGLTGCNQGVCVLVCGDEGDCKQGYLCQWGTGCVECQHPADCANGYSCNGGLCNAACVNELDCRGGYECTASACAQIHGGGTGVTGDPCAEHAECVDFCWNYTQCSRLCTGADDTTSCPAGSHCEPNHLVCMPG